MRRGARLLGLSLTREGAREIARRARGTPRVAGRLLRRVRDFASVEGAGAVDAAVADRALSQLEVDAAGLDALDHRYLRLIAVNYGGGPVGVETIAAALSEPRDAIEEIIEPYLLQQGFIARTPRGRVLTPQAFGHLGLPQPPQRRADSPCSTAATRPDDREMAGPRRPHRGRDACPAGAHLFRGHRLRRRGLSRQLSQILRACPLGLHQAARHRRHEPRRADARRAFGRSSCAASRSTI